jgi:hypothetical protein
MMPGIEFNEGIPDDIDNADYLDVSQRNLIVLTDLMTQSGKDLKTNVLPGDIPKFIQKQSYRQPPLVNVMYDAEQRMKGIMDAPQLSAVEKSKLYSDQLNRFLVFKNKMAHSSLGIPAQSIPQALKRYHNRMNLLR